MYATPKVIEGHKVQVMFSCYIAPGTYAIGQETIGWRRSHSEDDPISPHIPNESVEWYTSGTVEGSVLVDSLCLKVDPALSASEATKEAEEARAAAAYPFHKTRT